MSIIRVAVLLPILLLSVWSMISWLLQWRWRVHKAYGTAYGWLILATNELSMFVVLVGATAALLTGNWFQLLYVPPGLLLVMASRSVGEWWLGAVDLEDYSRIVTSAVDRWKAAEAGRMDLVEYGPVIARGYKPRSVAQLATSVLPFYTALTFASLGAAAHFGGVGVEGWLWMLGLAFGAAWLVLSPLLSVAVGVVRRRAAPRPVTERVASSPGDPPGDSPATRSWSRNFHEDD